jgi:hypothetical protein
MTLGALAASRVTKVAPPQALVSSFLFFPSSDSDYVPGQVLSEDGIGTM